MKKRKLLCLLALVACFTAPLAACGDNKEAEAGKAFDKYFYWEDDRAAYSQVVRYDGYVDQVDEEHNLAVIRSEKSDSDGTLRETYQVMDLVKGTAIITETISNPFGGSGYTLDVKIEYPVIKVTRSWVSNDEREYRYSYYLARENSSEVSENYYNNLLVQDSQYGDLEVDRIGSLYKVEYADKEVWINDKLEVLREFSDAQTDGYATPAIDGAYGDYLYAWSFDEVSRQIQVFNREGVCSMQYTYPSDVVWLGYAEEPVILNNGNILVQEHTFAEETATDYTYKAFLGYSEMTKMDVVSKIIDYKTGEVKEVELDYILFGLQAAYEEDWGGFPFKVRESAQNQAYIAKIVNKEISTIDYVTINNEGKIGYTVKNDYLRGQANTLMGNPWTDIGFVNEKYYYADVYANAFSEDDATETWIFDKNGKKVAELPATWDWDAYDYGENAITDEYIITWYGIYDYSKKCVYDFTKSEIISQGSNIYVSLMVNSDGIYLSVMNYNFFQFEVYKFDGKDFVKVEESVMELDTTSEYYLPKGNKVTLTVDMESAFLPMMGEPQYTWTLYKENGEALIKMQVRASQSEYPEWFYQCDGAVLIETETLDGEPIVYVVK